MNYHHGYHAGSFSDVVKHLVLIELITALSKKTTPFCYLDTHAGIGCYDLYSVLAQKKQEYKNGVAKITEAVKAAEPPVTIQTYLDCIHAINNRLMHESDASLRYYPGSPFIARYLLRPTDRIIACELQQKSYADLKQFFLGDKSVAIHHLDGFLSLKAFLPPPERRGLILIDPPYEDPDEFKHLAQTLLLTRTRFQKGVYAIWYPIKNNHEIAKFYRHLKDIQLPILLVELTIYPDLPNHLAGCGLVIINPPFQLDMAIQAWLPWLWKTLTINDQGHYRAHWLK